MTERWSNRISCMLEGMGVALRGALAASPTIWTSGAAKEFTASWAGYTAGLGLVLGLIFLTVGAPLTLLAGLLWPGLIISALTSLPHLAYELVKWTRPQLMNAVFLNQAQAAFPALAKRLRGAARKGGAMGLPSSHMSRRLTRLARGAAVSSVLSIIPFSTPLVAFTSLLNSAWAIGSAVIEPYLASEHLDADAVLRTHRWLITGYGLPFAAAAAVPFLGALVHPLAQAAAVYLVPRIEPARGAGKPAPAPGVAAWQGAGQPTAEAGSSEGSSEGGGEGEVPPSAASSLRLPAPRQLHDNLWSFVDSAVDAAAPYVQRLAASPAVAPIVATLRPVLAPVLRYMWETFVPEEQAAVITRIAEAHMGGHAREGHREEHGGGGGGRAGHGKATGVAATGGGGGVPKQRKRQQQHEAQPAAAAQPAHMPKTARKAPSPPPTEARLPPPSPARRESREAAVEAPPSLPERAGMEAIPSPLGETLMRAPKDAEAAGTAPVAGASGTAPESPSSRMSATTSSVQLRPAEAAAPAAPRFVHEGGAGGKGADKEEAEGGAAPAPVSPPPPAAPGTGSYAAVAAQGAGLMRARPAEATAASSSGAQVTGESSAQEVHSPHRAGGGGGGGGKAPHPTTASGMQAPGRMEAAMAPGLLRAVLGQTEGTESK